jgi:hypothetical protein
MAFNEGVHRRTPNVWGNDNLRPSDLFGSGFAGFGNEM